MATVEKAVIDDIEETQKKYLTFFSDEITFGIPIDNVLRVIKPLPITKMPEFPAYTKGVVNLRGNVVTIIDMRLRFGKEEKEYDDRTCFIVALVKQTLVGFVVDIVDDMIDLPQNNIRDLQAKEQKAISRFLVGAATNNGKEVYIIDLEKIAEN